MSKVNSRRLPRTRKGCPGTASTKRSAAARVAALAAAIACVWSWPAAAEKSDRNKPVNVEADKLTIDDNKKESIFEGNVTLTQGTLMLKADRVVVKQDAQGFNYGFAYGKPAYFPRSAKATTSTSKATPSGSSTTDARTRCRCSPTPRSAKAPTR